MIVLYHKNYRVTKIVSIGIENVPDFSNRNIVGVILDFAQKYKDEILIWCDEREKDNLNLEVIPELFHHKKMMLSYSPSEENYLGKELGYFEDSPFIIINKTVKYATWQMSSHVGAIHTSVLEACKNDLKPERNLDYFLNSFARRGISHGLFCYSEPKLLISKSTFDTQPKASLSQQFRFAKQHYRIRWTFLLLLNLWLFEKRLPLGPFIKSFFYRKRELDTKLLDKIPLDSNKKIIEKGTVDVLIPTIGRKEYLLNVLNNLASQTYLPKNVIIVEQNPDTGSQSNLDYIRENKWPFVIKLHFTHQTGACNARNIGLSMIESEFAFFADDDIVFDNDLLEKAMEAFASTGNEVFLVACHLKTQKVTKQPPKQFTVFGAGHAFVKSACFEGVKFNMAYEFGFGEDNDFGMQLRNKGFDILYISTSRILHLKAPIGGFRTKPTLQWQDDEIQPKPSPTLMLFRLLYDSKEQISNYKSMIFIKNLNKSFVLNPFKYIKVFRQKWNRSVYWANKLKER